MGESAIRFKVINLDDGKHYCKFSRYRCKKKEDKKAAMKESSLSHFLRCDQISQFKEVFKSDGRIWLISELMEGGYLISLMARREGDISEDFARWTLYQVALGIQRMHA